MHSSRHSSYKDSARTILLVDDNPQELALLVAMIDMLRGEHEYRCFIARNGVEAVTLYGRYRVDCAFVDYNMPDESGLQVVDMLHRLPYHDDAGLNLPVIIMSGDPDAYVEERLKTTNVRFVLKNDLIKQDTLSILLADMMRISDGSTRASC